MDGPVDAERHRVAQLLLRFGGPSVSTTDSPPVRLDEPHGLLDAALLVRADREPEVPRLDRLRVLGEDDPAAGERHALDADEELSSRPSSR